MTTTVTRNARLARHLRREAAVGAATAEMPVVATAPVQSLEAWLEEQWKELQWGGAADNPETRFLLPRPTALLLWERVIAEDGAGGARPGLSDDFATELLDLPRLARLAADAWGRLHDFGEPDPYEWGRTPETEAFNRWRAAFADILTMARTLIAGMQRRRGTYGRGWGRATTMGGRRPAEDGRPYFQLSKASLFAHFSITPPLKWWSIY